MSQSQQVFARVSHKGHATYVPVRLPQHSNGKPFSLTVRNMGKRPLLRGARGTRV